LAYSPHEDGEHGFLACTLQHLSRRLPGCSDGWGYHPPAQKVGMVSQVFNQENLRLCEAIMPSVTLTHYRQLFRP
jgi:hypothetical protein